MGKGVLIADVSEVQGWGDGKGRMVSIRHSERKMDVVLFEWRIARTLLRTRFGVSRLGSRPAKVDGWCVRRILSRDGDAQGGKQLTQRRDANEFGYPVQE